MCSCVDILTERTLIYEESEIRKRSKIIVPRSNLKKVIIYWLNICKKRRLRLKSGPDAFTSDGMFQETCAAISDLLRLIIHLLEHRVIRNEVNVDLLT